MNKYKITTPDGTIHTRSSATREYTHTVIGQRSETKEWINLGWCGSAELARKLSNTRRCSYYPNILILEAEKK